MEQIKNCVPFHFMNKNSLGDSLILKKILIFTYKAAIGGKMFLLSYFFISVTETSYKNLHTKINPNSHLIKIPVKGHNFS